MIHLWAESSHDWSTHNKVCPSDLLDMRDVWECEMKCTLRPRSKKVFGSSLSLHKTMLRAFSLLSKCRYLQMATGIESLPHCGVISGKCWGVCPMSSSSLCFCVLYRALGGTFWLLTHSLLGLKVLLPFLSIIKGENLESERWLLFLTDQFMCGRLSSGKGWST